MTIFIDILKIAIFFAAAFWLVGKAIDFFKELMKP